MAPPGDTLSYSYSNTVSRIVNAVMWLFVAGCIVLLTMLPLLAEKRDPYPWKFSAVAWLLAAAVAAPGVVGLNRRTGILFDRTKAVIVLGTEFFGRPRERRLPVSAYTQLGVRTFTGTNRNGAPWRAYALELLGPRGKLPLDDIAPMDRRQAIRDIAALLKLPLKVEDLSPGKPPEIDL